MMQEAREIITEQAAAKIEGGGKRRVISGKGLSRHSLFLRTCKECGVPFAVSKNHLWEEHGRILSLDSAQRLVIVERQIIAGILDKVAAKIGGEISSLYTRSKALDASQYVRSIMVGWKKLAAGYPAFKRPFYELLCDHSRILGLADASVIEYHRGSRLTIACTRCYSSALFAGDILGAIYAGEHRAADIEVEQTGGHIFFRARFLEGDPPPDMNGHSFSWEVPLPGHITHRRCNRCGIPFSVSFFSWNLDQGTMIDTHNGQPVALINVAGINRVHDQILSTEGDWVDGYLLETIKEMVDGILPGLEWKHRRPEERIRDLFFLAYRGMGNPIFTEKINDGIKARVENPFNYPLVAGIAASFLARGKPVKVEWERSMPGRLEIYVHFM